MASELCPCHHSRHHQVVHILKRRSADPNSPSNIGHLHNRTITFPSLKSRLAGEGVGELLSSDTEWRLTTETLVPA